MLADLLVKALVLAVISYEDELDTTFLPFPSRAVYECSTPYIVGVADVHSASRVKLGGSSINNFDTFCGCSIPSIVRCAVPEAHSPTGEILL
jgi:hypothetical protein